MLFRSFEKTREELRDIMKFVPPKKVKIHYTDFTDDVIFREEGHSIDIGSSDFDDYRARVNEYIEAHYRQHARFTPRLFSLLQSFQTYNPDIGSKSFRCLFQRSA